MLKKDKSASNAQSNQESEEESHVNSAEEVVDGNTATEDSEDPVESSELEGKLAHEVEEKATEQVVKTRGRPRKTDASGPPAKKSKAEKKAKARPKPERSSRRVANQKVGKKMAEIEEEVVTKRKRPSSTKRKPAKEAEESENEADQNGTTEELTVS